jgi:hypothetical protein
MEAVLAASASPFRAPEDGQLEVRGLPAARGPWLIGSIARVRTDELVLEPMELTVRMC